MHGSQTRRGFLGGMFTGVGVGAIALSGCVDQPGAPAWTGIVDPEPVAARAGLRYANVRPTRVPAVRQARPVLAH